MNWLKNAKNTILRNPGFVCGSSNAMRGMDRLDLQQINACSCLRPSMLAPSTFYGICMKPIAFLTAFSAGCAIASTSVASDLAGAKDSPLVSRFKGAQIIGYRHDDFGKAVFPTGPMVNSEFPKSRSASGRLTAIGYSVPHGKGTAEVLENYRQGLQAAGFKIV